MKALPPANILESMGDAFVALDTEWRYTYMNQKAGQIFNRRPEDMIGKHIWTEFPEGIGQPFYQAYYKAAETQTPVYLEEYYPPYNRWFENRIYPSPDGLAIFFQDITERKRAEQALRESEERLARIVETVPEGIAIANREGQITFANAAAERIFGLRRSDITDRAYDDPGWRITALDGSPFPQEELPFARVRQSGQPVYGVEHTIEHPDGQRVMLSINAAPLPEADGEFGGMVAAITDITERKQAEGALRKNEQTFSVIFKKAPFAAALAGLPEGAYVEVNEEFERVFGYTRQELVGKTSLELGMYPDAEVRARSAAMFREQGFVRNLDMRLQTRTGEIHDVLINSDLVEIGGEKYILTTANDITERRQAEGELQRNEQVLRLFVEHSPAAIAMLDRDMKYIVASRRYLMDYDLGEQNVTGRSHYDIFPEILERWKQIHRRCLAGAMERADEDPFPRASGKLDWVRWEIRPWYERASEIGGIILFSEVITERKLAEAALRESEELWRNVFAAANDAILILDAHYNILATNQSATEIYGYAGPELVRLNLRDLRAPETQAQLERQMGDALAHEGARWEAIHLRRDGTPFPIEVSTKPFVTSGRQQFVHIVRDITERKQAEAALGESHERLESLSKQLLEAQEAERRRIARELHDEVGQAFTALKLNLQSLERAPAAAGLGPQIQESIGIVEHAIQQVRNLSVELRPSLLDDLGLIPALRWHLDRYAQRTGLDTHFAVDPAMERPPSEIETVCFRVTQEALTNVMRHAQAKQVWVDLRQAGDEWHLTIRDDGTGFDARAARARAARGGSFGLLGMEERVLLIGGKIEIDSGPGEGTEIKVSFPIPGPDP